MIPLSQLHPMVVHFPIVFLLCLGVFDLVCLVRGSSISGRSCTAALSTGLAVLAGVAAGVTFLLGDMAFDIAVAHGMPEAKLEQHEGLGTWTAILALTWAVLRALAWWRGLSLEGGRKPAVVVLEIALVGMVVATAYFGGKLVYDLGVNTAWAMRG
ncbi:Uncharacterized membrane protein [Tistlia consotensis]|uniref:Uncharacterized membrane protein n=1 Tax=Tistlia consotensis USBA 355 TaxID=560819 RepID=A0A1Y6CSV4_9PROT|nr:DUF2231 domain-containing protein [Tistlia consotensis]SMF76932.1 Uncharacterized membrane protein [Tistlia consotensis USBA 355]SNS13457.1 Uncharacterized membrane protein [Tistlia consotensis]